MSLNFVDSYALQWVLNLCCCCCCCCVLLAMQKIFNSSKFASLTSSSVLNYHSVELDFNRTITVEKEAMQLKPYSKVNFGFLDNVPSRQLF